MPAGEGGRGAAGRSPAARLSSLRGRRWCRRSMDLTIARCEVPRTLARWQYGCRDGPEADIRLRHKPRLSRKNLSNSSLVTDNGCQCGAPNDPGHVTACLWWIRYVRVPAEWTSGRQCWDGHNDHVVDRCKNRNPSLHFATYCRSRNETGHPYRRKADKNYG